MARRVRGDTTSEYAHDAEGRLRAATGAGLWFDAADGFVGAPLSGHVRALATADQAPVTLAYDGAGRATLALTVRPSEVASGPILLAVRVDGEETEVSSATGLDVLGQESRGGETTILVRAAGAALHTLTLAGNGTTALVVPVGDLNADGRVDAADADLLPGADLDGDGAADATDRGHFAQMLGFVANRAPQALAWPVDLCLPRPVRPGGLAGGRSRGRSRLRRCRGHDGRDGAADGRRAEPGLPARSGLHRAGDADACRR